MSGGYFGGLELEEGPADLHLWCHWSASPVSSLLRSQTFLLVHFFLHYLYLIFFLFFVPLGGLYAIYSFMGEGANNRAPNCNRLKPHGKNVKE